MTFIIVCFSLAIILLIARTIVGKVCMNEDMLVKIDKWLFYPMLICFLAGFIAIVVCADSLFMVDEYYLE